MENIGPKSKGQFSFILLSVNFIFVFLILVMFLSCKNDPSQLVANTELDYVEGQVSVKTIDSVSVDFFLSFIDSLGLPVLQRNHDRYYLWIEGAVDSIYIYQTELTKIYTLFSGVMIGDYPFSDIDTTKKYIYTSYKTGEEASDLSDGISVLDSLGLILKRVIKHTREPYIIALLSAPIGKEKYWASELSTYSFIEFAELNYICHIH